jgi:aminopeptidase
MYRDFATKLARILTEYCVLIEPENLVVIMTTTAAEPLIEALQDAVMRRGAHLETRLTTTNSQEIFFRNASDKQLAYLSPIYIAQAQHMDVFFRIDAPHNTRTLSRIDPTKMVKRRCAAQPYQDIYQARVDAGEINWTITAWPTLAAAQEAEMGLVEYSEFVYRAGGLDKDDPVAHWQAFKERQERLVAWLSGKKRAVVRGPGIDLSFNFMGRTWVSCHGKRNFPDGEIYTSPNDDSTNGHVTFNFPSVYGERQVDGVQLTFKDGVVVEAAASKGEDHLLAQLAMDEGASRLGEFAIGTNWGIQQFTGQALFDEKIGGTIHMALGGALEQAGGINQSRVHWDMVHDMKDGGEIWIDGELFYQNGEFLIAG